MSWLPERPMLRTRQNLIQLAGGIAASRGAPASTVIKELLHTEILYCLVQSGAAEDLVFQGGTCLRLVHGGSRYSEDLDFAGGADFDPESMRSFEEMLANQVFDAYGLEVDLSSNSDRYEPDGVSVVRWKTKIGVPGVDPRVQQKQLINVEVANVRSHAPIIGHVKANYAEISPAFRQIMLAVESREEILADKIVALGARRFVKYRDVWDIKMLLDSGVQPDLSMVRSKLDDYALEPVTFGSRLVERASVLGSEESRKGFYDEMSRFVEARMLPLLARPAMVTPYLQASARLAMEAAASLGVAAPKLASADPGPRM